MTIPQRRFADHQPISPLLEFAVARPGGPEIFGPRHVEPDEIAGVVDDAHLISLGIVDADLNLRNPRCRQTVHRLPGRMGRAIFGPVLGYRLVVVSDAHLGVTPPAVEETLLAFLDAVPTLGDCLLINGDLFDFWFAYTRVVPRRGIHVVAALSRLRRHLPIVMTGGNHDRWGGDFWTRELGLTYAPTRAAFAIGQRQVVALHGDGLAEPGRRSALLHRVINHPLTAGIYRLLHPDFGLRLVDLVGPLLGDGPPDARKLALAAARQQAWAERFLADEPATGLVIMGHTHRAASSEPSPGRHYLNPGAWFDGYRYAIATETTVELHEFGASPS
jgi:UDP-2,3-diacylglucosamine hydrolase